MTTPTATSGGVGVACSTLDGPIGPFSPPKTPQVFVGLCWPWACLAGAQGMTLVNHAFVVSFKDQFPCSFIPSLRISHQQVTNPGGWRGPRNQVSIRGHDFSARTTAERKLWPARLVQPETWGCTAARLGPPVVPRLATFVAGRVPLLK